MRLLPDLVEFEDAERLTTLLDEYDPEDAPELDLIDDTVPFGIDIELDISGPKLTATRGGDIRLVGETDALVQWCIMALLTPRGLNLIYPESFGSQLHVLVGKNLPPDAVVGEAVGYIKEALLEHDRIIDVDDFEFSQLSDGVLNVAFTVFTDDDESLRLEGLTVG